ncbi:MAG: PRC-barrel domain-containing protein [archaeon]|nr:PRC-barrel domain-containing protein [archaeon]MCR4323534.1 PRC-barrel domain-containing protein [Nanoarchaeota archaeon]
MRQQKSISGKAIVKAITSEDILGKDVIDSEGAFIGVAEKVLINSKSLDFIGISVDKGIIRSGLTIGKNYISKITPHAIFLKITVVYDVKGKIVFDKNGEKIGAVSSIDIYGEKNKIKIIYAKPTSSLFFSKKRIAIPIDSIKIVGENVMLNITKDHLPKQFVPKP